MPSAVRWAPPPPPIVSVQLLLNGITANMTVFDPNPKLTPPRPAAAPPHHAPPNGTPTGTHPNQIQRGRERRMLGNESSWHQDGSTALQSLGSLHSVDLGLT